MGEFQHKKVPADMVNEGWNDMRHLLDLHSPVKTKPSRRIYFRWVGVLMLMVILTMTGMFLFRPKVVLEVASNSFVKHSISEPNGIVRKQSATALGKEKSKVEDDRYRNDQPINAVHSVRIKESKIQPVLENEIVEPTVEIPRFVSAIDTKFEPIAKVNLARMTDAEPVISSIKPVDSASLKTDDVSRKLRTSFYAGAAINVSGKKSISFENQSVHPVLGLQINFNDRIYLDAGLGLFSAVSRKQQIPITKEYVNNFADDVYYRSYTTNVVRVHYMDVPLTLNCRLSSMLSIGAGLELSRLYKSRIDEKKETYNFNEEVTAAQQSTFLTSSSNVGNFPRQVEVLGWDPRYLLQAGWSKGRLEVTGKYHLGMRNAVKILNGSTVVHEYDNTFLSLELRYHFKNK